MRTKFAHRLRASSQGMADRAMKGGRRLLILIA